MYFKQYFYLIREQIDVREKIGTSISFIIKFQAF